MKKKIPEKTLKKSSPKHQINPRDLLERLIENAIDFISQSVKEIEHNPKFSLIHFYTAIELFLKARLMAEHWSLIVVTKPHDCPDWQKFVTGDFVSVSLDKTVDKLEKIVKSGLKKQEHEIFKQLAKHRNKIIHFFHEDDSPEESKKLHIRIVKEQLTAWYFLHKVLTERWSDIFLEWSDKIKRIDEQLRKLRVFLEVVFNQLELIIQKQKEDGEIFKNCPSCKFPSKKHTNKIGELYSSECLVCGLVEKHLIINCPECNTPVLFIDEGFSDCKNCKREFEPEDLVKEFYDSTAAYIAYKDGDYDEEGHCSDCSGEYTVIKHPNKDGDNYFCTSCFSVFDSVQHCEWCNNINTGDMENSFWMGCIICEGKEIR